MRSLLSVALLLSLLLTGEVFAQDAVLGSSTSSKPKAEIPPKIRCHFPRKDLSFCKVFPNFSRRHQICDPTLLGHIEWCREDVKITEADDCGNFETYDAVTITYREVYENGAWGKKFRKTYRKGAQPGPITSGKGVVK